MKDVPDRWGEDTLTSYLDNYRMNQFATFVHKRGAVENLIKMDGHFEMLIKGAVDPEPFFTMNFLFRAHSAFRSAVGAVMAGQLFEAQTLLRLTLEHAAYAIYVGDDEDRFERWMRRSESSANREAVRREFTHAKIKRHLIETAPDLGAKYEIIYERVIDYGAHPNEQGFSLSTFFEEHDNETVLKTAYLHGDRMQMNLSLQMVGQVGLWAIHAAHLLYPRRADLLGMRGELEKLRQGY